MPIIKSTYQPPFLFKNNHLNTVYKTLFYKNSISYNRQRIFTPDKDFLDLDFSIVGSNTLVIAMHGLEGSSKSHYLVSAIHYLNSQNIDCVALNFRGCSGEDNNQLYSYNSGKTDDLSVVLNYILEHYSYKNIILLGYSMGGNITLKYMGETNNIPSEVKGAVAISVPCDLEGSSNVLAKWYNTVYIQKFLKSLKKKTFIKLEKFPENTIDKVAVLNAKTFEDFDNAVTAPLFQFKSAKDYWNKCSSKPFIHAITKPTLLINAIDDSFLSESCYPIKEAKNHKYLTFEIPKYGGHVGFNTSYVKKDLLWSEKRISNYIEHIIS
ncbi:alpha/beta hydrolase [Lutibacter profundi]|uniref:Alpha/beta hydrolase n=1 Tax=Lutibacter profundi TaxID=1622118 RepID=A0A109RNB1_9FLAO|nr:alpha/beta fold hydrolase [Lutibacter profundi]AMC10132.1 alpha/beta hydrolase [Lutibacter profundi]